MDLRRTLAIIRAWLPLLIAGPLLAGVGAWVLSNLEARVYQAQSTLIVGQSLSAVNPDYNQLLVSQRLSTTYATVATTRPNLDAVIARLGLAMTSDELLKKVAADAPLDSTLLTITARDVDPGRAAAIANALAEQLIAASPAIQGRQAAFQASIDADLQATQDQIKATQARVEELTALPTRTATQDATLASLDGRLVSLRSTYATLLTFSSGNASNLLSIVEPAVAPVAPVSPRPLINALLAAFLGLLLAAALVAAVEYFHDAIKDSDEIQDVAGVSTLGTIARMREGRGRNPIYLVATLLYPRSGVAEAYRTLRANIEFASVDTPLRTLLVTSSVPGEGKTVTAANLAVAFAQAGREVLLVDADLRKPGVQLAFNLANTIGLTTLLPGEGARLDAIAQPTEQANLRVLTTGPLPPNPAELLGSQRMRAVLDQLKGSADLVIFDSPPLQAVTDSAILSSFLDATVLVIDAKRSRRRSVRLGREALARAGANVIGAVLNRVPGGDNAAYNGYYGDHREKASGTAKASLRSTGSPSESAR